MRTVNPINITGIDHVVLRVEDPLRMLEFYCDVLGCRLERHLDDLGLWQLRAGRSLIDLIDVAGVLGRQGGGTPDPGAPNMDHLCLAVSPWDAEGISAHLSANGVDPGEIGKRYGATGTGPSMYLRDPEGNTVELKGPG
ncbi:MAG: VOC family protein [Pseudomonadales bacterium]